LLNTLAATAASTFVAGKQPTSALLAHAAVHGYTTAFWWAAGIFAIGALLTVLLLRGRARSVQTGIEPEVQPAAAS
jgi:membrane protein implicated in regulation of membrane protease activity